MNFAKQLIKQAIKDNHLLTFASQKQSMLLVVPINFYWIFSNIDINVIYIF